MAAATAFSQLRSGDGSPPASLSMLSRLHLQQQQQQPHYSTNGRDQASPINETTEYSSSSLMDDTVHLNPDLCYQVGGLSSGQKKLCVQNTSIMPAISRGARSAIQVSLCLICTNCRGDLSRIALNLCLSLTPSLSLPLHQECKRQFKHRRYNCETVDDDSVFGPITSLGE